MQLTRTGDARSRTRIAVLGAGLMGHGIAQVFAAGGHDVALHDPVAEVLSSAPARIEANLGALGHATDVVQRVSLHAELEAAVADAEFVFEAAPEKVELKRAIFVEVERNARPDAILATNTSVIPVTEIMSGVQDGARAIGTHWWNPPYLVPLVEVVQAQRTDEITVARMLELLRRVGKEPVHVRRDVPGFVGNRLQHALWREAIALVAEGVCDGETVDRVVKASFGRRLAVMGPIENADYVGLDLTLDIHEQILPDLNRSPGPSPYLRELVERGDLGMKTGRGLREWAPGDAEAMRERLLHHLKSSQGTPP